MDYIGVAVVLFCAFYVTKCAECRNEDVVTISGCDVSLHWTLGETLAEAVHATIYHSSGKIAQILDGDCETMDNLSASCNISKDEDEWILSLTMFNVTEHKRGDYSLWQFGPYKGNKNTSKRLVVIGKPHILEVRKPILHQSFDLTCNAVFGLECFIYKWKVNGSEITPVRNVNAYHVSSLRMIDNFSQVTCQVCLNETASSFSNVICKRDGCSADSDPYVTNVIYGPENISLSLNKTHVYLNEYEPFTIECSASCSPECIYTWKVHHLLESEKLVITGKKLVITNFESKLTGRYTCYVTNQEINITSKSSPIILQQDKGNKAYEEIMGDSRLMQYWMGPVIVSVVLLIVGYIILVILWRKNTTRAIGQINGEVSETKLGSCIRPLPSPAVHENVSRTTKELQHPNVQRNAESLHDLSNQTEPFWIQIRENVPVRTLFQASHTTEWQRTNSANSVESTDNKSRFGQDKRTCIMGWSALGSGLLKLFSRRKRMNNVLKDDHYIFAGSRDFSNLREDHIGANIRDDLYSTIEEDTMSVYFHRMDNLIEEASHETGRSTGLVLYDYALSTEMYHAEKADVDETAKTYINPTSDLACPIELCANEETNVLETDQAYITPINCLANPIEIGQVEETDMIETDAGYITPIN